MAGRGGAAGPPVRAVPRRTTSGLAEAAPWQSGPQEPGWGVVIVLALCIALAPLVSPKGPGNGGPIDLFVAVGVTTTLLWAVRRRARLQFPYLVPVTVFVTVGLASALGSAVAFRGGTAVAQEIFLFLWCAAWPPCAAPPSTGSAAAHVGA